MILKTFLSKSIIAFLLAAIVICSVGCFLFYDAQVLPFAAAETGAASSGSQSLRNPKPAMGLPDALSNSIMETSSLKMRTSYEFTGRIYNMKSFLLIALMLFTYAAVLLRLKRISYIAGNIMGCSSILALPIGGNSPPIS